MEELHEINENFKDEVNKKHKLWNRLELSTEDIDMLTSLSFIYGRNGRKHCDANDMVIHGILQDGENVYAQFEDELSEEFRNVMEIMYSQIVSNKTVAVIKKYFSVSDNECIMPCKFVEDRMIGSVGCQECIDNVGFDLVDKWVRCLKHDLEKYDE